MLELKKIVNSTEIKKGTFGQDWANLINENFSIIDSHNHTGQLGVNIFSHDLGEGYLNLNGFDLYNVFSINFDKIDVTQINSFFICVNKDGNLFYKDVKITDGNSVSSTDLPNGFTLQAALSPRCFYSNGTNSFNFLHSDSTNSSLIKCGTVICENIYVKFVQLLNNPSNIKINIENQKGKLLKLTFTLGVPSWGFFDTSSSCLEKSDVYKLDEKGKFLYDDKGKIDTLNNVDMSYFLGAKSIAVGKYKIKFKTFSYLLVNNPNTGTNGLNGEIFAKLTSENFESPIPNPKMLTILSYNAKFQYISTQNVQNIVYQNIFYINKLKDIILDNNGYIKSVTTEVSWNFSVYSSIIQKIENLVLHFIYAVEEE